MLISDWRSYVCSSDLDRQARPGVRRQVVVAARLVQLGRAARQRHLQLQRLGLRLVEPEHYRLHFREAVIVLGLVVEAQGGALGALRRRQESHPRRAVGELGEAASRARGRQTVWKWVGAR